MHIEVEKNVKINIVENRMIYAREKYFGTFIRFFSYALVHSSKPNKFNQNKFFQLKLQIGLAQTMQTIDVFLTFSLILEFFERVSFN